MAKQQREEDARNRFLQVLSTTADETWTALDQDVGVGPATNRNFDYRLGPGERRIALELFRLVKDEAELARDRVWSEVVHALEPAGRLFQNRPQHRFLRGDSLRHRRLRVKINGRCGTAMAENVLSGANVRLHSGY